MSDSKLLTLFNKLADEIRQNATKLVNEGQGIVSLEEGAEEALLVVYKLKKMVEELEESVRDAIKEKALSLDPELKKIKASKLVVSLRSFGYKYGVDETMVDQIPEGLVKKVTRLYADSKAVDEWIQEHDGKLPVGIILNRDDDPSKKSVRFYPKKGVEL